MSISLGIVKTIFVGQYSPLTTDVLWYDSLPPYGVLKYWDTTTLKWQPLYRACLSGAMTATTPTAAQITTVVGLTAVLAGAGFQVIIRNTTDGYLYFIESNGADWHYIKSTLSAAEPAMVDLDGNVYHTVIIGTQEWLLENLRTTKYADSTSIPNLKDSTAWAAEDGNAGHDGAYIFYTNDPLIPSYYGAMYNWYAVNNAKGLACFKRGEIVQAGWRVATRADWLAMRTALGQTEATWGGVLKETGTVHWSAPNIGATNSSGFAARAGGERNAIGLRQGLYYNGKYWVNTTLDAANAYLYWMDYNSAQCVETTSSKKTGMSVRCVKDV